MNLSSAPIDVRTLTLQSFRDAILLPVFERLHSLLALSTVKDSKREYDQPRFQQMHVQIHISAWCRSADLSATRQQATSINVHPTYIVRSISIRGSPFTRRARHHSSPKSRQKPKWEHVPRPSKWSTTSADDGPIEFQRRCSPRSTWTDRSKR